MTFNVGNGLTAAVETFAGVTRFGRIGPAEHPAIVAAMREAHFRVALCLPDIAIRCGCVLEGQPDGRSLPKIFKESLTISVRVVDVHWRPVTCVLGDNRHRIASTKG